MVILEATKSTPRIECNETMGRLQITGESYPENSFAFFEPVFEWLRVEFPQLQGLECVISIRYMNSSSTKCILDILDILDEGFRAGKKIGLRWRCESGNERAFDLAQEFMEDCTMPFTIESVEPGVEP